MGIKTVPHPSYSPDVGPCDFWLFPKLRGYRYETIEEMKEAVTKLIDTLTQENFDGAFQKLLERYNKCIAAGGDYFEGDESFMCVLSIKVPIRKKSGNLFNDPRIYISNLVGFSSEKLFSVSWYSISLRNTEIVYQYQVTLTERSSSTLFSHWSLSFIALGRSSG